MRAPDRIGPYEVIERLGRGGFGTVYLCRKTDSVRRPVAIKLINPGVDSDEVLARFRAEREVLSLMSQRGIAQLLDAGATEDGTPFFVMEYVPGQPITEYVQSKRLVLRARLELFVQVLDAVRHAHQRGVIHRDLTANNVLVTEIDGEPVAKIIDFGIAKSLGGLTDGAVPSTLDGQMMGTPEYMSPEQAEGRIGEIDTRTDIYALGVLLYQLLTDTLPFDPERLRNPADFLRIVRAEEPPRPSMRVLERPVGQTGLESSTRLARQLGRDLDWVALKAMAKERERRYQGASALRDEIRRVLDDEPVLAGPPSTIYRVSRFLRRHRAVVIAAAAVMVALLVGLVTTTGMYFKSESHLANFDRLSDVVRLEQVEAEAAALWPEIPALEGRMRAWLTPARALADRLEDHRRRLHALRAGGVASGDAWVFAAPRDQFLHDALAALVTDLSVFATTDDGALRSVQRRLAWATTVYQRTIVEPAAAWQRAAAAVRGDARFAGLDLQPQLGLMPLGPDPRTGLQEFVHLRSGAAPVRGEDGRWRVAPATGIVLVLVPGGRFQIGAQPGDPDAQEREHPVHAVTLQPFLLSKYEMTQAQWTRITGANPSIFSTERYPDQAYRTHPVENATWTRTVEVLRRLDLVLPTEAQWEYACRAGTSSVWCMSSQLEKLDAFANTADLAAKRGGASWPALNGALVLDDGHVLHAPVGSFDPNAFGLHDMHGNVFERCVDRFGPYTAPVLPGTGERRVDGRDAEADIALTRIMRGGSYATAPVYARSSYRWQSLEDQTSSDTGVRPARGLQR